LDAFRAAGAEIGVPWFLAMLAEVRALEGQREEALSALDQALVIVGRTEQHHYEAELYRQQGELLLRENQADLDASLACFRKATAIAQQQGAKSWELRATIGMARLLDKIGKHEEALTRLTAVYNGFSEGFDTVDLKEAKALLEKLRS
jgi:predicted ATPase